MRRAHYLTAVAMLPAILLSPLARADERAPLRVALVQDEPGTCNPPCREGYFCQRGQCASLCNPPCKSGERCTLHGECESRASGLSSRYDYFALISGYRAKVNSHATGTGEIRLEFGGKYVALQIGPGFGDSVTHLRGALMGHVVFRPIAHVPFYLVPTVALGYSHTWIDGPGDVRVQDLFITPGLRVRFDPARRVALFADVIQPEISFLRMQSSTGQTAKRVDAVPVHWTFAAGVGFLY